MTVSDTDQKGSPQACLFVAHIAFETTEDAIRGHFAPYGEIISVKTLKDRASRPYAFVQFMEVEDAENALEKTSGSFLENRRLRVEKARVNRTLFVAKLSKKTSNNDLREMAEEFGEVESVSIIKNHQTNMSKGCGFVKFVHREDAQEAFVVLKAKHKNLVVEWATSTNDPDLLGVDKCNIFVGGLNPQQIDEEILADKFGSYGEIESSTLVNRFANDEDETKGTQRSAFAFIRYKEESAASAAIENENGIDWLDRRIRVQYCESQEMKNKRRANKYFQAYPNNGVFYPGMIPNQPMMVMGGMPWNPYSSPAYSPSMYPMEPMPGSYPYMMYPPAPWGYPRPDGEMPFEPSEHVEEHPVNMNVPYPNAVPW
mmetsp:Transcript_790/g.995  ORF Transcript_790/g.995 Transcript_790/m.995 type:complete len:371 (-) Transcript_790:1443-2555(-)